MCEVAASSLKRQAGGTPTGNADTWRLANKPGHWAFHAHWPHPRLQPPDAQSAPLGALELPPVCCADQALMRHLG